MIQPTQTILVLGGKNVGKTTYGAQLLDRLSNPGSAVRLKKTPDDLTLFAKALERLSGGLTPEHTGIATNHEISMTLELPTGKEFDLIWPDYGGEQVFRMIEERRVSQQWHARLQASTAWVLFVRLSLLEDVQDFYTVDADVVAGEMPINQKFSLASAAFYVELLQMMLYLKAIGTTKRVASPKLAVLISCWDEMEPTLQQKSPPDVLKHKIPLLDQYVNSIWDQDSFTVWGLSSQGQSLDDLIPNDNFMDCRQTLGYVVSSDGRRLPDLTLPILGLVQGAL